MSDKAPAKSVDVKKEPNTPTPDDKRPSSNQRNERGGFRGGRRGGRGGGRGGGSDGHGGHHHGHGGRGHPNTREQNNDPNNRRERGQMHPNPLENVELEDVMPREEKKFTGRCRLFVGNITSEMTEEDFKSLFTPFGEVSEVFVNASKGFGFIRMDYFSSALSAKKALDGTLKHGRNLRVKFASHASAVKVKNLSPFVSNELLFKCFSQFGEVERAIVFVDDRGRSLGEGQVEFARKPGATACMKRVSDGILLMSSFPRPVACEPVEPKDTEDGLWEKFIPKNDQVRKDREKEPRFAAPGSFEYRFAMKWREMDELEKKRIEMVKREIDDERRKLENEMENSMYEYQAEKLRADLMRQQEELQRLEELSMRKRQEMGMRLQEENRMMMRAADDEDRRREMMMMRAGGDLGGRGPQRGPQAAGIDVPNRAGGVRDSPGGPGRQGGPPPIPPPPAPPAAMGIDNPMEGPMGAGFPPGAGGNARQSRFEQPGGFGPGGPNFGVPGNGALFGAGPGGMGGRGMDRRREEPNGPRDDYGDLKRMRRY